VCYGDVTINFYLAACAVYREMRDELKKREARRLMRYVGKEA
jgi:hypothetical protein